MWRASFKTLALVFILSARLALAADVSCQAFSQIPPELSGNGEFWALIGDLSAKNQLTDEKVQELITQFTHKTAPLTKAEGVPEASPRAIVAHKDKGQKVKATFSASKVELDRKAVKSLKSLQPSLQVKVKEFIDEVGDEGMQSLSKFRNGRWQLEKLEEAGYGPNAYSVRVNHGYRIVFRSDATGALKITDISKTLTHRN